MAALAMAVGFIPLSMAVSVTVDATHRLQSRLMRAESGIEGFPDCNLPEGAKWCTARSGDKVWQMAVYKGADPVSSTICNRGFWEFEDPKALGISAPASGARLLDIGANVGWYSLMFAQHGYDALAVEPMTANRALLNASICANPELAHKIQIVATALTDKTEPGATCTIFSANTNQGDGMIACGKDQFDGLSDYAHNHGGMRHIPRETVPMTTLDQVLLASAVPRIDVMKMDVERYECVVLGGGSQLFSRFHPKQLMIEARSSGGKPSDALHNTLGCVVDHVMAGGSYKLHDKSFAGPAISTPTQAGVLNLYFNSA